MRSRGQSRPYLFDLTLLVAGVLLTAVVVFVPVIASVPFTVVFPLLFVSLFPGYGVVSSLFPELHEPEQTEDGDPPDGIDTIERIGLSIGTSLAIVSLVGLALSVSEVGLSTESVFLSVSGVTLTFTAVAWFRRLRISSHSRRKPIRELLERPSEPRDRLDGALTILTVCAIVLAVSSVGYTSVIPGEREQFSELYILSSQNGTEPTAANYPENITVGEPERLLLGVSNREFEPVSYTVVATEQRLGGENGSTVVEQRRLRVFQLHLAHGETWQQLHRLTPTFVGDDVRIAYFLYRGDPPPTVRRETAYRALHLTVNVSTRPARSVVVNWPADPRWRDLTVQ